MTLQRTALVTGVSGFAGRQLAAQLAAAGWEVVGTVLSRSSGVNGILEVPIEISDRKSLERLLAAISPAVVFHLAAIVDTVATPDVKELHRVNTGGTLAVIEAMRTAAPHARLVFASSSFAYGRTPPEAQPVTEDQPLDPITPYGISKADSEAAVARFVQDDGADAVVARAFQHTGPGHVGAYALADWALQLATIERDGGPATIVTGNLDVERDYLDVRDVASAYRAVAEHGRRGATYNVCSGEPVSMRTLLVDLIAAFDLDVAIDTDPSRLRSVDQPCFYGNPGRLVADTGWTPRYTRAETLGALATTARERLRETSS